MSCAGVNTATLSMLRHTDVDSSGLIHHAYGDHRSAGVMFRRLDTHAMWSDVARTTSVLRTSQAQVFLLDRALGRLLVSI